MDDHWKHYSRYEATDGYDWLFIFVALLAAYLIGKWVVLA